MFRDFTRGHDRDYAMLWQRIHEALDANAAPIDALVAQGKWRAFVYFDHQNVVAWKAASKAKYTVPPGRALIVQERYVADQVAQAGHWRLVGVHDTATAEQSFTLASGLDGDADVEYKVCGRVIAGAAAHWVFLQPNADATGGHYANRQVANGSSSLPSFAGLIVAYAGDNVGDEAAFEAFLVSKTGARRTSTSTCAVGPGGTLYEIGFGAQWTDTAADIASFTVNSDAANTIGIGSHFELWARSRNDLRQVRFRNTTDGVDVLSYFDFLSPTHGLWLPWAGDGTPASIGANFLLGVTPVFASGVGYGGGGYPDGTPTKMTNGDFTDYVGANAGAGTDSFITMDAGSPQACVEMDYYASNHFGGDGGSGVWLPDVDFYTSPDNVTYTLQGSVSHAASTSYSGGAAQRYQLAGLSVTARYFKYFLHARGQWTMATEVQALSAGGPALPGAPTFLTVPAGKAVELDIWAGDTADRAAGGIVICREV